MLIQTDMPLVDEIDMLGGAEVACPSPLPQVEDLRARLSYCPQSGAVRWRKMRPGPKSASDQAGCIKPDGYRYISFDRGNFLAHRLIWKIVVGRDPVQFIDHINGHPADNRWANLREASHAENMRNGRMQCNNTSGATGVRFDHQRQKWRAEIKTDGRLKFLGRFNTLEAARDAYAEASAAHHGPFVRGWRS